MQQSILLMDNKEDFLDVQARLLEQAGYQVFRANSLDQAEEVFDRKYVLLAILDIRMEDEDDEQDISGLTLAQKPEYRPVPKIILTAYPNYESARQALGPVVDGLPSAVNFIGKAEGPKTILEAVKRVFDQYVRINWDLIIRWAEPQQSFWMLTGMISSRLNRTLLLDQVDELENLFRHLFYDSHQITVGRLFLQREGQTILEVFAYNENYEEQFIVSCGYRDIIKAEEGNYDEYAPKALNTSNTLKSKSVETVHFAATAYVLTGANLEEVTSLTKFYNLQGIEPIISALDNLYGITLASWYQSSRFRDEEKILSEWALQWPAISEEPLSLENLEVRVQKICEECVSAGVGLVDYMPHTLIFHLPEGITELYPNPVSYLVDAGLISDLALLCSTIHGHITKDTVLVDRQGRTWLIDFSVATRGPLLRDFVSLETSVKFDLMATLNFSARFEMERYLTSLTPLTKSITTIVFEADVQKTLQVVEHIRKQTLTVRASDSLKSYLAGLFFCTGSYLATFDPIIRHTRHELIPYLHSLLSAAMLCQTLAPSFHKELPLQALNSLWIEKPHKAAWVEGRKLALTSQEFTLLDYLYNHKNQLCSRTDILQQVFNANYGVDMSEQEKKSLDDSRLNSTISRLRRKVEPNPSQPKYIIVVRGEGYRLDLEEFLDTDKLSEI